MKDIINLLKSNLFWTVLGVLAAAASLWYAFSDTHKSSTLLLSTGHFSAPADMDKDKTYAVINLVFIDDDKPYPSLVPVELSIANTGKETVKNVGMRFYYDYSDKDYNRVISNTMAEKPYDLSLLYMRHDDSATPVESGSGYYLDALDPGTSSGSDYSRQGIFTPVYFTGFAVDDYQKEKFTVEIKGDNTDIDKYKVVLFNCPIKFEDNSDLIAQRVAATIDAVMPAVMKEDPAIINTVYCMVTYRPEVTIDKLPFFVGLPRIETIKSNIVER